MKKLPCSETESGCTGMVSTEEKTLGREPENGPYFTAHACSECRLLHNIVIRAGSKEAEPMLCGNQKIYLGK